MGSWGTVEFESLKKLAKDLDAIQASKEDACIKIGKELASRFLRKVKQRTPKRTPDACPPGVKPGTLQKGWRVEPIEKQGSDYVVTIYNPIEYANYVEYGHRTRNHKGWVQGKFFMTISEQELQTVTPQFINKKVEEWLKEVFS